MPSTAKSSSRTISTRKSSSKKAAPRKREGVIVREGVSDVAINSSEKLGLKWKKPSAVMTGAGKVKAASGAMEEQNAAGVRPVLKGTRGARAKADAPAAQTIGFARGAGAKQSRSRNQRSIATATTSPTSRAEPRASGAKRSGARRTAGAR